MFHVISCRKYAAKTIRVVDVGETSIDDVMGGQMGECILCGPCSHVEVGVHGDWWQDHGAHETADDAMTALWGIVDEDPIQWDRRSLPEREEAS